MRTWYKFWQSWTQVVFCACFNIRCLHREHVPAEGPVLLVSNHQSYLDPPLCGAGMTRELDYVARDSLFHNRYFGRYIRSLNAFPIARDQADIAAIRSIIQRLQAGRAIVLFPEGTRSADGSIQEIKSGIELIARKSGATTVPVVVDGAFEVWPRHQALPGLGPIRVYYGPPITPAATAALARGQYVAEVNRRLRQMQTELRTLYGKRPFCYNHESQT